MILHINNSEYDYHALVKVAEMAGLAGLVGFHESEDGYIVSFPDTENTQALINDYNCLLYTSPSPRDYAASRMPSSA